MSLVRALVPALRAVTALGLILSPAAAYAGPSDSDPQAITPTDEVHARGLRVLAALLLALKGGASPGTVVWVQASEDRPGPTKIALNKSSYFDRKTTLVLKNPGFSSFAATEYRVPGTRFYKMLPTFSPIVTIMSLPISTAFAAPCDRETLIGWPRDEAPETLRAECTRDAGEGERLKLSDGLHRRRLEMIPDVRLGISAPPSPYRMNQDGFSRTHLPALYIAKR